MVMFDLKRDKKERKERMGKPGEEKERNAEGEEDWKVNGKVKWKICSAEWEKKKK